MRLSMRVWVQLTWDSGAVGGVSATGEDDDEEGDGGMHSGHGVQCAQQ